MIETSKPLSLILKKVFAEQILNGEKNIEIRSLTDSLARKVFKGAFDAEHMIAYNDIHFQVGYTGKFLDVEIVDWRIWSLGEIKAMKYPISAIYTNDYDTENTQNEQTVYDFLLPSAKSASAFEGDEAFEKYVMLIKLGKVKATNMR